jgi:hypothetical protein
LTTLLQRIKLSLSSKIQNLREDKPTVIETQFFILTLEQYQEHLHDAEELNVTLDYYLSEFCDVQGPLISTNK